MNNRIKKLANDAFTPINDIASEGIADRHTFNQDWFQLYSQNFAELIIKECAEIAKKEQAFNDRYTDADKHPQVNIDQCILIEFGL